ncbi:MAG: hypothetical protein ACJAYE_003350 [Candidatus Azotimanducaceae bacterium]|jgi:hypothetical protein
MKPFSWNAALVFTLFFSSNLLATTITFVGDGSIDDWNDYSTTC